MPLTLFHLGPGLALGLPLRRHIHAPTFIFANVICDFEPLLVLLLNLDYPLHGYLHTFLLAAPTGMIFGYIMFLLERPLRPLYKVTLLETSDNLGLRSFVIAGGLGTALHVLFDTPLYSDIRPFFPATINPIYNPTLTFDIYTLCVIMGAFGITYYIATLLPRVYRNFLS